MNSSLTRAKGIKLNRASKPFPRRSNRLLAKLGSRKNARASRIPVRATVVGRGLNLVIVNKRFLIRSVEKDYINF